MSVGKYHSIFSSKVLNRYLRLTFGVDWQISRKNCETEIMYKGLKRHSVIYEMKVTIAKHLHLKRLVLKSLYNKSD